MAIIDLEIRAPILRDAVSENRTPSQGEGGDSYVAEGGDPYVTEGGIPACVISKLGPTGATAGSLPPTSPLPMPNGDLAPVGPSTSYRPDEAFSSLLNEITLPMLKAEDETKPDGKWEPKELRPRHREMMRRILEGATYVEIAEEMGLSTQSVMLVCSSAIFKEELRALDADLNLNVIRRAEELSNEALDKLKVLMRRARSEALQASCAEKVLGIAGYSKIEKKQVAIISGEDVIRELNRKRRERSSIEDARTVTE
jgi:hypothetical protein